MKKTARIFSVMLAALLLCGAASLTAYARELEPCDLCGGSGDYLCISCGNTGTVTCGGCGGSGVWECPGEEGRGKCDNGFYVCPSCHGDTYIRSGDGEIPPDAQPGSCGTCAGTGRLECWTCHGAGGGDCDKCGGSGKEECQVGTCKVSRAWDWKCPDCKGTGFILVGNPMPSKESNDGTQNIPVSGDRIITDRTTWAGYTYGSGSASQTGSGAEAPDPPQAPEQPPVPTGPEEYPTELAQQDEDTSAQPQNDTPENDQPQNDTFEDDIPPARPAFLPDDRNTDHDILMPNDPEYPSPASVRVEPAGMTDEEQRYYASLPEEELARLLDDMRPVAASAEPGRSDPGLDGLLNSLAAQNGYERPEDGRLFPLFLEGRQELGFPVRFTVSIEKGLLDGGTDLFIYRLADDGTAELTGRAEYRTYDDGSVEELSFYSSSLSTFFTAAKELDLHIPEGKTDAEPPPAETESGFEGRSRKLPVIVPVIAAVIAALAIIIVILVKKRKTRTKQI